MESDTLTLHAPPNEDTKGLISREVIGRMKHGFNMNYWGHPCGVSENIVVVYNSEKGMDAYYNMGLDIPFTGNRTNLVIIP